MVYPGRKVHDVLREFVGTNTVRPTPEQWAQLLKFDARVFQAGLSLCQLAQLTDWTETAIRHALDDAGVHRRGRGAMPIRPESDTSCK